MNGKYIVRQRAAATTSRNQEQLTDFTRLHNAELEAEAEVTLLSVNMINIS